METVKKQIEVDRTFDWDWDYDGDEDNGDVEIEIFRKRDNGTIRPIAKIENADPEVDFPIAQLIANSPRLYRACKNLIKNAELLGTNLQGSLTEVKEAVWHVEKHGW